MERTDRDQNDRDVEELMEEEEDSTHMERPRLHHTCFGFINLHLYIMEGTCYACIIYSSKMILLQMLKLSGIKGVP